MGRVEWTVAHDPRSAEKLTATQYESGRLPRRLPTTTMFIVRPLFLEICQAFLKGRFEGLDVICPIIRALWRSSVGPGIRPTDRNPAMATAVINAD
jgi:hypothetical protein